MTVKFAGTKAQHRERARVLSGQLRTWMRGIRENLKSGHCDDALRAIGIAAKLSGALEAERSWFSPSKGDGAAITSLNNLMSKYEKACVRKGKARHDRGDR